MRFYKNFTRYRSICRKNRNGWLTPKVALASSRLPAAEAAARHASDHHPGPQVPKIQFDYRSYLQDEANIIESKAANTPIETEPLAQTGK